jgi:hypothetical protein
VHGLKDTIPDLQGATFTEEFPVMVMRKLFTLNCAHAAAAYLGYREGCQYIHEAAAHPRVVPVLEGAIAEAKVALQTAFPHQTAAIERDASSALERIANAQLADPISRVAGGPRRKLSPRERLVGPARLASQYDLPHEHLCMAIAAALTYAAPEDPQAMAMQQAITAEGVEKVLTEDCGLLPHDTLAIEVKQHWLKLVGATAHGEGSAFSPFIRISTSLEEITQALVLELSQHYDRDVVEDILTRVAQKFQEVRVWSYVPILMKKQAVEQLRRGMR